MAKKVEEVPAPAVVEQPVAVEQRRSGLAIAAIAVGALVVAGALFGGGVLVGTHLPQGQGQAQFGPGGRGGFPTGPNGMGGPGPVRLGPGTGQGGQGQTDDTQP